MAFVAAPNIVQAQVLMTFAGQQIENRFMIDTLAAVTPLSVESVADAVWEWANTHYRPVVTGDVGFRAVLATDMSSQTGPQFTVPFPGGTVGQVDGPSMPNETTLAIALKSASRGRSANGRMFLASLARSLVTANNVDATFAGQCVTAAQQLVTDVAAAGYLLVIVSYIHNHLPRVGGPIYFPVVTAQVTDLVVDSQRRRKPGVGS